VIPSLKKRFWQQTCVVAVDDGFEVLLDQHRLRTPSKSFLIVPTKPLAEAIAAEWQAQTKIVDPATMPMTRRANAAIDKVIPQQAEVVAMLAEYGGSDLLCYRATHPVELVERQARAWDPVLDWAATAFDGRLLVTQGVMHVAQDQAVLDRMAQEVATLSPFALAGFHDLVTHSGSLVLALALIAKAFDAHDIWQRASVDEQWQIEQWGADDEANATEAAKKAAFFDAHRFFYLDD
jgi:chaperone required for assembly of F1-ATPase